MISDERAVWAARRMWPLGCLVSAYQRPKLHQARPDGDELVVNPHTPFQIGKHPPAASTEKIRPAQKGCAVEGTTSSLKRGPKGQGGCLLL